MVRIGFIGAGNMARSLAQGLIQDGIPSSEIVATDPDAGQREQLAALGIRTSDDNALACQAQNVIVAVKPQIAGKVLTVLPKLDVQQVIVSIMAGIKSSSIETWLGGHQSIIRCMPNTPALLGAGMTGMFASASITEQQTTEAERILGAVGETVWVAQEDELDAVTALSGSGPAYFFLLMEAMLDAGRGMGLSDELCRQLVVETAKGAAMMAAQQETTPATLRQNVTSPGGTTAAALSVMEQRALPEIVGEALEAARLRAGQMANEFGEQK